MEQSSHKFDRNQRLIWAATRASMEADNFKHRKYGDRRKQHWDLFEALIQAFGQLLKLTPLYQMGAKNAANIVINRLDLPFDDLPQAFHGYSMLHMTDLHLDFTPGIEQAICELVGQLDVDLCVLTGDYRNKVSGSFRAILSPMQRIVAALKVKDGIIATLGNHDTYQMVDHFEAMGITLLANESIDLIRGEDRICFTGIDDPYYYYTDQALNALESVCEGFKIALIHAPSLYDVAADNGYRLYLCGHTHGGQICLPKGKPIILHLKHGRKYYRGLWRYGRMTGYTGQGTGTVGIPVRFNTRSEITIIRLMHAPQ